MLPEPIPELSILNPHPELIKGPQLLHELVREHSSTAELAIDFLEHGSRRKLSYEVLHALSNALARRITSALAKLKNASAIIPVFLPQCPELYITLLAILKAGKAFCPLSLDTPDDRLNFILKDLAAELIITNVSHRRNIFGRTDTHLLLVDERLPEPENSAPLEAPPADTEDIAYVLYTSGSTGLPKAVRVSHRAATQSLLAHHRHIPNFSRFLQFAAPTFDVAIFEIFFPLYRGRTLVGCSREQMLSNLPAVIGKMSVDAAELTPTVVSNLLQGRKSVPRLSLLLTIGEMLTRPVVDEFGGNPSQQSILWGMYGPTEAAIHCTLQPSFHSDSPVGTIGFPLDTVSAFVAAPVAEGCSPAAVTILPVGEAGELLVGGPQIASGYINRPELSAAAFIPHVDYGLLYRTGDKARVLPNGTLECLGRITLGQIKLRGQRVELGEIEQAILRADGCRAAAAVIIDENVVAFYAGDSQIATRETVAESCKRWLPSYMVPADFVYLRRMPQVPSGKIDKRALESCYRDENQSEDAAVDRSNSLVHGIVRQVLGRNVSPTAPLASFGLDSLRSIRIASILRENSYGLGAMDVLSAHNLEDLISLCATKTAEPGDNCRPLLDSFQGKRLNMPELKRYQHEITDLIPCTPLQEAMLAETIARASAYCNWIEVELPVSHTYCEIRTCLEELGRANEILRSGFITTSISDTGSFAQVIWNHFDEAQIVEVTTFSKRYTLSSIESVLRPLTVQINATLERPRVLFQIHHALYDGWTFDLVLRDLGRLLDAKPLDPRPQYREVVEYYSQISDSESREASSPYWKKLLEDYHPHSLPNFNGRIIRDGKLRSISKSSSIDTRSLYNCAKGHALNPQVYFQAGLAYIISSYLDIADLVIGTVTSGRTIPVTGIERIMGPCIASLPLRLDMSRYSTAMDMLHDIQHSNRGMLHHCTLPLREISKLCGLRPGQSLFDVLFVWQQSLFSQDDTPAIHVVDSADELEFKLTLEVEPHGDSLVYKATFDSTVLPEAQIRHLFQQLDDLVDFFLHEPHCDIDSATICFSPATLSIANSSPVWKQFSHGPAHAVEKWAIEAPEKEALVFGALVNGNITAIERLTYAELNTRANRLSHALLQHTVVRDELVGVIMEKSTNLYVTILAVLKLGHGYLPIVPETPLERIRRILAAAEVKICISDSSMSELLRSDSAACTVVDIDHVDLSHYPSEEPAVQYCGSNLAYAVFTSGSTGTPKGVLVTQNNLMSNLDVLGSFYPTGGDSKLLQACSQAFDVSVFEIFFAWYAGMCLCSATRDDLYHSFEDSINRLGITHLSLTPTVASLVDPSRVPSVQFLVTAGEALTEHVRRQWAGKGLYQGYGPSETTNICTVRASVTEEDLINNIGQPFSNTSAFVLEPNTERAAPRGAIGELCFGGAQVFRGYLKMPELNAKRIIDHPQFGRIYRSGDMGRLLSDNSILFTGRSDDQVKVRGQRVELSEITSNVLNHSEVEDCVTLLFQKDGATQRLVTFWVPRKLHSNDFGTLKPKPLLPTISEIFESLTANLPTYMVPTHLIPISSIPLTSQSKVDKQLLFSTYASLPAEELEPASAGTSSTDDLVPFTEAERKLAQTLSETIPVPISKVSRSTSFFSLGLDSISAIRLSSKLRGRGIADIPVSAILKNPTIARLSLQCDPSRANAPPSTSRPPEATRLLPAEILSKVHAACKKQDVRAQKVLPCTPLQEAMLSSSSAAPSYCNTMVFEVKGDIIRLEECWSRMCERHEILRTAFLSTDDARFAFVQVVLPYEGFHFDELKPDQDLGRQVSNSLPSLLDSNKPPMRLVICRNGDSTTLIFSCHHALYDGAAITALLGEVEKAYSGEALLLPVPYESYLQHIISQDLRASDEFWASLFAGFEPSSLPSLSNKVETTERKDSSFTQRLQVPLSHVSEYCQAFSVSLLPVIQATWAKLLQSYLGEEDVCFGNVVSGRTLPENDLDRLIAPCFNTLPIRLNFDFGRTNEQLIRHLHSLNIDMLPFQLTPLRRIQAQVLKEGGRLFDSLVILQQPMAKLNETIWTLKEDIGAMDLPIVCEAFQDIEDDALTLTFHYSTSILSENDAKIAAATFEYALLSLLQFPQSPAKDTTGYPSHILARSNLKFKDFDASSSPLLHSALEHNAALHPDLTALEYQHADGTRTVWTFQDLNAAANQIAHALRDCNIERGDVVPVHISKSPQFYASILGVLKAGAAFAPIHPDLPLARKRFMVSELRPKVILCVYSSRADWCDGIHILPIDTIKQFSTENPIIHDLAPTNLAYCIYTSGSTGLPKAVTMDHQSPIQTIQASRDLIPWNHDSRLLQYAATSFDMCYYDCFLAWSFGFALCAADQDIMLNDISSVIRALNVDLLDLTPSVAASLIRAEVPNVKWLYCIGEAMSPDIVREWEGACVNSYGPTEAAFCTTMYPVQRNISPNTIGKPFPTTSFAVYPRSGERALPVFGIGELYIGGAQLARGYYGNTSLTDQRFVQRNGQRFYKTGDMVRMLGDGNFAFVGRVDDQVKIRGLRVELGEINHVIQACDDRITSVTAQILRRDADAKDQLVAFISTKGQSNQLEHSAITKKAKQAAMSDLPRYMVPHFYIFVEQIPKSAAGKIDRKALREVFRVHEANGENTDGTARGSQDHEWTDIENLIREVLARLSETPPEKIAPSTSIYQLGLDSISAVQVAAGLRKKGFDVSAVNVLKYANCRDLAAFIDEAPTRNDTEPIPFDFEPFEQQFRPAILDIVGARREDIEAISPCTPVQRGMISQFITSNGNTYFNYMRLRLNADVDTIRLKEAWQTILRRHRILRTGFAHVKDKEHPFVMLHYTAGALQQPWDELSKSSEDQLMVEKWFDHAKRDSLQQLHRPPWHMCVNGETSLHLAILHVLFDAQSLQAIFRDVSAAYNNVLNDTRLSIEPALGAILKLSNAENTGANRFWTELGKKIAPSRFPNLAPLRYDRAPSTVLVKVCTASLEDLEAGCRKANTSLQAAGIASWASLLSAYSGESSVTFGVVLSGRNLDATESAVFPCITTVPFAITVPDDREVMLRDVLELNAEIQQHQFTPLNEIQRLTGFPNEALFDTLFAFQKLPNEEKYQELWTIEDERATTEYPLSIELEPKGGQLELRLTFLPHTIPHAQATLVLDQLEHLINTFVFSNALSFVDAVDDGRLYSITPAKEPTLPTNVTLLHEFVEFNALRHPNRIALEFATSIQGERYDSRSWTYSELDAEGNRVASLLIAHDVHPGGLIGICFDKCPEASFAMLGILKAGCAFVALDPAAPKVRKEFILKDSSAKVVLSMEAQSSDLSDSIDARILNLDRTDLRSIPATKPILRRPISNQDCSYCLFTSGTTGAPKGCEITHENAVQFLLSFQRIFEGHWNEDSRWLQFASFHFDVSVLEQYWSWSVGIRVVSAPRDILFEDLAAAIKTLGITHIDLTPSLARVLHPDDVPSLCKGVFITGGESLKQEILDDWGPKGVIYNGYGPTEATIGVTMYPRVPANGKPSNIGPQFDNVGSLVLRPGSDVPVLRGGVGELCVSGKLVGKGYLNRTELTDERFPHLARFHERVYRTGDLVRILHDGSFDFLGRADDQVKLRGQRLEIGEINSVIKRSGIQVSDVVTLVLKHPKQQKQQLVSFVVTVSRADSHPKIVMEKTAHLEKAREACQEQLPGYMVPTHFVALSSMPLSANNKADRRKLKQMYESLPVNELQLLSGNTRADDEDWSSDEGKIRDVFHEMLEISADNIKKNVNFFELGLDSVSVIGFSRALKQAGFSKAAASIVLKNATISRLANALNEKSSGSSDRGSIMAAQQVITAIQHRHRRDVAETLRTDSRNIEALAPCTPLQQGVIARSLEGETGVYFNTFHFRLARDLDEERLRLAWEKALGKIQILRTVFVNTEDGFVQAVLRKSDLHWNLHNISNDDSLDDSLARLKREWWRANRTVLKRPFELHLVRTPGREILVVHMFHALYDGISIELVFDALWEIYNERSIQDVGPSFQPALAYGPLRPVEGAREFWLNHLSKNTFRPFPTMTDKSSQTPATLKRDIRDLSNYEAVRRQLNVTPQAVAQACWATVLHKHAKGTVTLGIIASGRNIDFDGADNIIGPMINTLPYQHQLRSKETWASIVKRTHEFNVAAHSYQHTPLRDIMKWTKRNASQPLFDTLFAYQIAGGNAVWAKNDVWELEDSGAEADYPLALEVEQNSDATLKLTLVAQGHVLDGITSNQLLDEFEEALKTLLKNAESLVETPYADAEGRDESATMAEREDIPTPVNGTRDFQWTPNAKAIREEIANLAATQTHDISELTSIFELGLDSIDAIKLSSKLKKRGIFLPVSGIMRGVTIANMVTDVSKSSTARILGPSDMIFKSHKRRLEAYVRRIGMKTDDIDAVLPLTPLQEAMAAEMIASGYTRYYNHNVLKLSPDTDLDRLQRACTTIVEKSPILRTSFIKVDDPSIDFSFAQVVHGKPHAFSRYEKVEHEPDLSEIIESIRKTAVASIEPDPLFHIHLVESPNERYLVLSIAHALYDGVSLDMLHSDISRAYQSRFNPRLSYEPALCEILTSSGSDAAAFWRDYLSEARPTTFKRRSDVEHQRRAVHRQEQSSKMNLRELTTFAKKNKITLQALGQTVYALVLASYTRSLDVTFGSVLSGRDNEKTSKILFPTMNTVAIRTILHGSRREMLQYAQGNLANIKQWQHFPLRKAQTLAGVQGMLFESLFIYQKAMTEGDVDGRKLYESVGGHSDVEYPVCVETEVMDEAFVWRCAIKEEVFDRESVKKLLYTLDIVLKAIVERPDAPTLEFTSAGTSICGLPAFKDYKHTNSSEILTEAATATGSNLGSPTAKVIREVLAFVSKTPEEEIREGMTIFHIGLDSISAIKVSSLLRKRGIALGVGEMLKAGTIEKMARVVNERTPATEQSDDQSYATLKEALQQIDQEALLRQADISEVDVETILPATAGQIYMISMWLKSQGSLFYPDFTYRLCGSISYDELQSAWHSLVTASPILRTCFLAAEDDGTPYIQVILRQSEVSISDVSGMEREDIANVIKECASKQPYAHIFVSKSSDGWSLRLKIYHALYDGVSLPLLMQQLQDVCKGIKLASSPINTVSKYIATTLTQSAGENRKLFWTQYLRGIKQHHLRQPRSSILSKTEIFKPRLLSSVKAIDTLARKHGITTQSLFLAIYAKIYAALASGSPSTDVVIGIYLANRSHPILDISQATIPTVNLVPLRVSAPRDNEVLDIAARIQYDIQEISTISNSGVGLWEIDEWTGVRIDTFVNFLKLPESGPGNDNEEGGAIVIKQVNHWDDEVSRVTEMHHEFGNDDEKPAMLVHERVNGSYLHAIDIEATIRDGALDVGVFALEEMLSLEGGERLIQGVKMELEKLGEVEE